MGWGSFLGNLAKNVAGKYIEERGVKGTLEDLGSMASSAKNFFSSNNQSNAYSDDDYTDDELLDNDYSGNSLNDECLLNAYNQYMDDCEYELAIQFVEEYYSENNREKDYMYFFLVACAQEEIIEDGNLDKAIKNYNIAYTFCSDYSDYSRVKERLGTLYWYRNKWMAFDKMNSEIEYYIQKSDFLRAKKSLKKYYGNEEDFWYWNKSFEISKAQADSLLKLGQVPSTDFNLILDRLETVMLNMTYKADNEDEIKKCKESAQYVNGMEHHRLPINEDILSGEESQSYGDVVDKHSGLKRQNESAIHCNVISTDKTVPYKNQKDSEAKNKDIHSDEVENEYIEELKASIDENGNIPDRDQRLLDRLRKALGISEERAEVLKNQCVAAIRNVSKLSESLKEYAEAIRDCLGDNGTISDKDRRILERMRKASGISETVAITIETEIMANLLTPEEKEYAEEIKACLADDGLISDRERRILERLRKSLNISSERAKEIESIYSK